MYTPLSQCSPWSRIGPEPFALVVLPQRWERGPGPVLLSLSGLKRAESGDGRSVTCERFSLLF